MKRFTLLDEGPYVANLHLVAKALADRALDGGAIVECGTWRGGMAGGLVRVGGNGREYHFFDSFDGLPPATAEDGLQAKWWQDHPDGTPTGSNCRASLDEFVAAMRCAGVAMDQIHVCKGFFQDTFPQLNPPPIAILRLDADWYESTVLCLETFWPSLLPRALVIIDDYYEWEGCRKAVHSFLAGRADGEAIRQSRYGKVAYLIKQA